jgi:hypothetical protein
MTAPSIKDYADEPSIVDRSDREPPIRSASQECAAALDKLTALIAQLEDRLEPVRFRSPVDTMDEGLPVPGASPLAMDLRSYRESMQRLQRRIGDLLEELEI